MFKIKISAEIQDQARLLVLVDIKSKMFTTEKVNALIEFLKPYNSTLLITDRLNYSFDFNEKETKKLENILLSKFRNTPRNVVTVNNAESWDECKNENILKIIHWKTWRDIKKLELEERSHFVKLLKKENQEFNKFIQLTVEDALQQKARSKVPFDEGKVKANLIDSQIGELACVLTFSEFQVLLHPGFNKTQTFLYDNFQEKYNLPKSVIFSTERNLESGFFSKPKNPSNKKLISFAGRQTLLFFQIYMDSSEVPAEEKKMLVELIVEHYQNNVLHEPDISLTNVTTSNS